MHLTYRIIIKELTNDFRLYAGCDDSHRCPVLYDRVGECMSILIYFGLFQIAAAIMALVWSECHASVNTGPATRESVRRIPMGDIGHFNLCQAILATSNDEVC